MAEPWQIHIYEQQQLVFTVECPGPVELGRQSPGEGRPYLHKREGGCWRIVLARADDNTVSRKHVRIEPLPDGRVSLTNQSLKLPVRFTGGTDLPPDSQRDVALPVTLGLGHLTVSIEPADSEAAHLQSLPEAALPPGHSAGEFSRLGTMGQATGLPADGLLRWIQAAMDVLHSAAHSADFFDRAATALVERVGLDVGWVLVWENDDWRVQAVKTAPHQAGTDWIWSRQVLSKVREEKRTFWRVPLVSAVGSLRGVKALVAAPLMDRGGEVIGALYGARGQGGAGPAGAISRLEAMLVELLAGGVAAGLARLEQEQAALQGQKKLLRLERDLEIGHDIQAGFLPEALPQLPGWEVGAHFRPAREVGGDFYDAFVLPDDHLALVIADVCDKGVGAALFMTLLRSLLRAFAQQAPARGLFGRGAKPVSPPGSGQASRRRAALLADLTALSTVEFTNDYVATTHGSACMFASVFFGVLDAATGALTYVNAGHDPPILIGATGVKARLSPTGPVVGMSPDIAYEIGKVVVEPGDTLLAYTDGVTEARNGAGAFFTEARLLSLLAGPIPSVPALLDGLVARLDEHTAGAEPSDDVTMLAVRRVS